MTGRSCGGERDHPTLRARSRSASHKLLDYWMQFRIPDAFNGKGLSDDVHRVGTVFGVFERKANLRRLIAERTRHRQRHLLGRNVTNVDIASSAHEIAHVANVIGDADAEPLCHCNARSLVW